MGQNSLADYVGFWKLEETSGSTRNDEGGNHNLTDHNTVGQTTGKIGNCADFGGSNQYLDCSATGGLNPAGSFSVCCWFNPDTLSTPRVLVSLYESLFIVYQLQISGSQKLQGNVSSASDSASAATTAGVSTATWYFGSMVYNGSTGDLSIQLNNGTAATDNLSGTLRTGNTNFILGQGNSLFWYDGKLDSVVFYNRVLDSTELTSLYNGGSGNDDLAAIGNSVRAGGAAGILKTSSETAMGGCVCGGAATVSVVIVTQGGVVAGGAAGNSATYSITATGGGLCGGAAGVIKSSSVTWSGGGVLGGVAKVHMPFPNGYDFRKACSISLTVPRVLVLFRTEINPENSYTGTDFRFEDESGNRLPHDLRSYDDGLLIAAIKVHTSDFYLYYGKE